MSAHLSTLPRHRHPFLLAAIVTTAMLPARSAAQPAAAIWELAPGDDAERSPTGFAVARRRPTPRLSR